MGAYANIAYNQPLGLLWLWEIIAQIHDPGFS